MGRGELMPFKVSSKHSCCSTAPQEPQGWGLPRGTALPCLALLFSIIWLILKKSLGYQNDPSSFTLSPVSFSRGLCDTLNPVAAVTLKGCLSIPSPSSSPKHQRQRPEKGKASLNLNSAPCLENLSPAATDTRLEGHNVTRWCQRTGTCPW